MNACRKAKGQNGLCLAEHLAHLIILRAGGRTSTFFGPRCTRCQHLPKIYTSCGTGQAQPWAVYGIFRATAARLSPRIQRGIQQQMASRCNQCKESRTRWRRARTVAASAPSGVGTKGPWVRAIGKYRRIGSCLRRVGRSSKGRGGTPDERRYREANAGHKFPS